MVCHLGPDERLMSRYSYAWLVHPDLAEPQRAKYAELSAKLGHAYAHSIIGGDLYVTFYYNRLINIHPDGKAYDV